MAKVGFNKPPGRRLARMRANIKPNIKRSLKRIEKIIVKEIKANLSGRILNVRSGELRRGLQTNISVTKGSGRVIQGVLRFGYDLAEVPYARIHELGGWTGRGHATKIKQTAYMRRAVVTKKNEIRTELKAFTTRLSRG